LVLRSANWRRRLGRHLDTVQFAAMVSGIAGAIAGLDAAQIDLASQAGANAAANNYLAHPEQIRDPAVRDRILAAGEECKGQASCQGIAAQAQAQIDLLTESRIAAMCASDTSCVADRQLQRSIYAQTRDAAVSRLDPNTAAAAFLNDQAGKSGFATDQLTLGLTRMQNGRSIENNPVDQYVREVLASDPPYLPQFWGSPSSTGMAEKAASTRVRLRPRQAM
jgi:filamentous hemagglutinin